MNDQNQIVTAQFWTKGQTSMSTLTEEDLAARFPIKPTQFELSSLKSL